MVKSRKVQLTPPQQHSYDMMVQEGYRGSPADFLEEQRASTAALVERLNRQENDPVLRNVCQIASQLDELRQAHDDLRQWLQDEIKDIKLQNERLQQTIRDGQQPGITKRPRYYPDDDGGDFGFPGA